MTRLGLIKRLAITWFGIAWFAWFALDLLGDAHPFSAKLLRAIVAGFFVALSTAPAYYWRLKKERKALAPEDEGADHVS